jgi:hypothetical protein
MTARKEKIRDGLEIDFDLLDSDLLRCYIRSWLHWSDGPVPRLLWVDHIDRDDWVEGQELEPRVMMRTLDDATELAQGRRFLRLQRYSSYACLAELAQRPLEEGDFVVRKPPDTQGPTYLIEIDEEKIPQGLGDPDLPEAQQAELPIYISGNLDEALRLTHAQAIRLTIRVMLALGYDVPGDNGDYWEPVRFDIAQELHKRAVRRPRPIADIAAVDDQLEREPQE